MVGGGLAVQQESVIAVGQHDRGAAAPNTSAFLLWKVISVGLKAPLV